MTARRRIEVILKISDLCNLRCSYCFDAAWQKAGKVVDKEVLDSLPRFVEMLKADYDDIEMIFHGGEPLTAPPDVLSEVMDILDPFGVEFHVQTNLARQSLTEYAGILQRLDGLSFTIDGPAPLHDAHRHGPSGSASYAIILRNLDWIRSQFPKLSIGVLCTLSNDSVSFRRELYAFFKELGVQRIGINPVFDDRNSLSNDGYFQILREMFTEWIGDPKPLEISLFVEALKWVTGIQQSPNFCYGRDCYRGLLSISTNGSVNPCLHWQDDKAFPIQSFRSLAPYLVYNERKFAAYSNPECCECCYESFCRGGCPREYVSGRWYFCEATRDFLTLVRDRVVDGIAFAASARN